MGRSERDNTSIHGDTPARSPPGSSDSQYCVRPVQPLAWPGPSPLLLPQDSMTWVPPPLPVLCPWCTLFVFFFSFFKVLLKYGWFTTLWQFLLYSKVIQLYVYTHPLSFRFFSRIGHHRSSGRVPWAIQHIPVGQSFHIPQCAYANPKPPVHPSPTHPPLPGHCPFWQPQVFQSLWVCFCSANKFVYPFSRFHI